MNDEIDVGLESPPSRFGDAASEPDRAGLDAPVRRKPITAERAPWVAPPEARDAYARMAMMLFAALRGNVILWQGEELGLTQVDIPFEKLQDPEAIANWPLTLSRDGTRTPMPWMASEQHCGFSNADPWLPLGDDQAAMAVDRQLADETSLLSLTRDLLAFRNAHEAILVGDLTIVEAKGNEEIEYDGETHTAANLFDALKEGYYGKF